MKRIAVIVLLLLGIVVTSKAQYLQEFGKVSQYEAEMTEYPKDPQAEAIVIYENGTLSIVGDDISRQFEIYQEKEIKIKILKQEGLDYATFEIPFYTDDYIKERVVGIEGITFNYESNGLVRNELDKKFISTDKIDNNWRKKGFTMPNVKVGSIICIKYTLISSNPTSIRRWEFQKKIPVVNSTLVFKQIPYYEFVPVLRGMSSFDVQEVKPGADVRFGTYSYQETDYTYGKRNIPAFKDEAFITTDSDYMMSLSFMLKNTHSGRGETQTVMKTWPQICKDFLDEDYFGKYMKDAEKEGKKIISQLNLDGKSEKEKVKIISDYIKKGYSWDGNYSRYTSQKVSEFMKAKTGNSADVNLFLLGLLKAAKIEAQPILLSTRDNGAINPEYPSVRLFNYEIVKIGTGEHAYFADATERLLAYNELPARCIHVKGLVVAPHSNQWIDISQTGPAVTEMSLNIKCDKQQNKATASITYTARDYDAFMYRSACNGKDENLKKLLLQKNIIPLGAVVMQEATNPDKPFVFTFATQVPLKMEEKIAIAPFLNLSNSENIFNQDKRTLPIDLILEIGASYQSTIEIPEGYEVEYLPQSIERDQEIKVLYKTTQSGNTIKVDAAYQFKKSIYEAEKYNLLKSEYGEMIKLFNDRIILKKK